MPPWASVPPTAVQLAIITSAFCHPPSPLGPILSSAGNSPTSLQNLSTVETVVPGWVTCLFSTALSLLRECGVLGSPSLSPANSGLQQ